MWPISPLLLTLRHSLRAELIAVSDGKEVSFLERRSIGRADKRLRQQLSVDFSGDSANVELAEVVKNLMLAAGG